MMSKLAPVFLFELRATLRRRTYQVVTAAIPALMFGLLLVALLISTMTDDDEPKLIGYVDQWGKLPVELPAAAPLRPYSQLGEATAALLTGDIEAYFVFPASYVETGVVQQYRTADKGLFSDVDVPALLQTLVIQALIRNDVTPEIAARVQRPAVVETIRLTPEGEIDTKERDEFSLFVIPYGFSMLLFFAIAFTSGGLVQSVTEEKQTRTIEILLSSLSPFTLMGGKILGLGVSGLLQVLVWGVSARIAVSLGNSVLPFSAPITIEPIMLILGVIFFLLAYLFYGTIMAGLGALTTSPQEGSQFAGVVTMFAMIPLIFVGPIIDEPNGSLARVLTMIPFTSPLTVMLRLSATAVPWADIALGAALLVLSSFGVLVLSARVFRAFLLLYGRRPGLREFWRALRTA